MKKLLFLLILPLFVFAGAFNFDSTNLKINSKKELKIATFNVENLFDGKNNGNEYGDFKIGKSNWSNERYLRKLERLANLLKDLDADIIGLQEIENSDVLSNLAQKSGYKFKIFSKDRGSPFGVGLLSKIKIKDSKIYRTPNVKTRDILRVDFEVGKEQFSVFVNHFPSFKNPPNERKAVARTLKNATKDVKNAILLGDFNSDFRSDSLLDDIVKEGFVDLWSDVRRSRQSSHISNRAIDHILLSKSFFGDMNLSYQDKSFKIFTQSGFYDKKNMISDHYPLYFTLNLDADKNSKTNNDDKIQPEFSLDEIYGKIIDTPVFISSAVVIYKEKYGFVIALKGGRGIYVLDRKNRLDVGQMIDLTLYETDFFKDNFQISDFQITRVYNKKVDIAPYLFTQNRLNEARHGDVIDKITGDVKDGKIYTKFGEMLIFSHDGEVKDGKNLTFKNAFVTKFEGKMEIIVR